MAAATTESGGKVRVVVGLGSCGIAAGAQEVRDAFERLLAEKQLPATLGVTGCNGACHREPIVEVYRTGRRPHHLRRHHAGPRHRHRGQTPRGGAAHRGVDLPRRALKAEVDAYFGKQTRVALRNCGVIDPESIDDYLAREGYQALRKVLAESDPDEGHRDPDSLRPAGPRRRRFPHRHEVALHPRRPGDKKYVICNADEGDPGAFMDRSVLEGDPHSVLEGMAIAAFAVGADEAYIYCRAEYPLAIKTAQNRHRPGRGAEPPRQAHRRLRASTSR